MSFRDEDDLSMVVQEIRRRRRVRWRDWAIFLVAIGLIVVVAVF